jgi:WD40 repeat protein
LLARGKYTSNCLTQARFLLRNSSLGLITASTDGHFTLWNLTPILEPFYLISAPTLSVKHPLDTASITPENITCESRYQVHSNSIKSVELVQVSDAMSLVVAGGDDNALSLSLLDTGIRDSDSQMNAHVATVSIPDAHAASVTAVKVLGTRQSGPGATTSVCIASSGNDHRVKIWSVDVDLQNDGPDRIAVRNVVDEYTNVADVSSLDVVCAESRDQLLLCGVGMEMLDICHAGWGSS